MQEALRGALIKKGTKLAYRLATKKYPELFKKKKLNIKELKSKKVLHSECGEVVIGKNVDMGLL